MSRPKSRNVLLSGNALSGATTASSKDELLAMKYVMEKPADHIYALDEKLPHKTYPDYNPWAESDRTNPKLITTECLNNGYFEPPSVANEYFSARNLIQETLLSSESGGKSLLQELSLNLTRAYKVRNEVINKITSASHTFRLPPRVTLTASKRDAWLRDLANAEVPLSCVSSKIPHGIRNKVLIDHMCTLKVPVSRALWFVKCVLCSEQMLLRKKFHSRQSSVGLSAVAPAFPSLDFIEGRWLQEWTSQVADYVLKFSREMPSVSSPEKRAAYSAKLAYLLRLIQTLYIELLLDRTYFLSCVVRFLVDESPVVQEHLPALLEIAKSDPEEGSPVLTRLLSEHPLNYGQLLSALTLVRTFWHEILHHDFLCKQLGEMLLLNFFLVERVPIASVGAPTGRGSAFALPLSLKEKLLALISASVVGLFLHNSNAFIVPDSWLLTGSVLYRILAQSDIVNKPQNHKNFEDIFRLINFRNESLMLNMRYTVKDKLGSGVSSSAKAQGFPPSTTPDMSQTLPSLSRSSEDTLMFIDQLDAMNLRSSLALSLRPTSSSSTNQDKWRTNVRILVKWCTSAYRDMGTSCEKVLILCNFVKKKVLQPMTTRGSSHLKAEFESEILESIFSLAEESLENLSMHNLFVLINEFYQLKIISISSYLRKIIACGIFYISSSQSEMENENPKDPLISFHLAILSNLPALNNKQHYQILSKWTPDAEKLSLSFDRGMEISKTFMLKSLVADSFPEEFKDYLQEIRSFSVGVKFLLVNWLTSQIKTTITQSPKLIHISPSTIARIYEFYSVTDNLTVFFRVFIRFVLKNEDKVIIYYLDTLDYIGKLLQHHYLLVNFLPGNNIDRVSAAYELYNLIISAYHDLSSREPDLYNFKPLWEFMNQSVDKKITDVVSNNTLKSHDPELDKYIFSKESAESPLKVQVPTPRRNQVYSAEQFVENLNQLLYRDPSTVSAEDVSDFFQEIGSSDLDFSMDAFSNEAQLPAILEKILDSWKTASSTSNERQDCAYSKLVKFTTSLMKGTRGVQATVASITNTFQRPFYEEGLKSFLIKIISYRILSFADVITVLKTVAEKTPNVSVSKMIISLVFGPEESVANLAKSQEIMFNVLQTEYKTERIDEALHFAIENLKPLNDIGDSDLLKHFGGSVREVLMQVIINHKAFAFSAMTTELPPAITASLCRELLRTETEIHGISSIVPLSLLANEFSLPFLQLLLRVITSSEHPSEAHIGETVLEFLGACQFSIETGNSYFGELFNYLEWEEKTKVFKYLETFFLTHRESLTTFENEDISEVNGAVFVFSKTNQQGTELLPVFKDFFKKFSVVNAKSLDISVEKFQQFSELLVNILQLVSNESVIQMIPRKLHDIISIFLRLLIIHSSSLTDLIAKNDSVNFIFLKNMMGLLNSAYLANGQDKLKILLFDLLLQIKGSLTQALVATPNEDLIGTSPQASASGAYASDKAGRNEPSPGQLEPPGSANSVVTMSMILDLPEPGLSAYDFGVDDSSCLITLDNDEINHSSDIALANDDRLVLMSKEEGAGVGTYENPFKASDSKYTRPFRIESVGLIEDTSSGLNNGCISLSMFGAYTTKENPY